MKVRTRSQIVNISNKDLKLKEECSFKMKALTASEIATLERDSVVNGEVDIIKLVKGTFLVSLVDWSGLVDEDEKELKCTEETKNDFYEHNIDLCQSIITAGSKKLEESKKK